MNLHTTWIMELAKVNETTALDIQNVIDNEWLIDRWSEASNAKIRKAIKLAQTYIANGYSWEVAL